MNHPDPIAFSIGNIDVRWYGVLIASAMLIGIFLACKRAARHGLTDDDILDTLIWTLPMAVIGSRAYYVLFNLSLYDSLAEAINIRNGGLAIHGALIAAIATIIIICRRKHTSALNIMDLLIPLVALGQAIGRWGNFFNGEAHGGPTDLPWGIIVDGVKVHPTFLYESIWCLLLFIFLSWMDKNRREFNGQIIALYGVLYSIERFFVEGLRTDSLMIGSFRQAQVLSLVVIIVSIMLYIYCRKHYRLDKDGHI